MKNKYSPKGKKYLFICKHNFTRSKYGAEFFRGFLKGKGVKAKVESAGLGFSSFFLGRKLNPKILKNSDVVFVMESWMKYKIVSKFNFDSKKIFVLNIKDVYGIFRCKSLLDLDSRFRKIDWKKYIN